MDEEIVFIDYVVTCETLSCGNGMVTIQVKAPEINPYFICGVCSQQITNYAIFDGSLVQPEIVEPEIVEPEIIDTTTEVI